MVYTFLGRLREWAKRVRTPSSCFDFKASFGFSLNFKRKAKTMKKILSLAVVLAIAITMLLSCGATGNVAESGTATIVIETANTGNDKYIVYEVDLSLLENKDEGALSLLEYISAQENSTLYYSATWGGGYGAYVNSIGSLSPLPNSTEYISIYTSEECDFAVPSEYTPVVPTVNYGEVTLKYSGVGISSMTINDGTVVLFRLESY